MDKLKGKIMLELSDEKFNYINELIERDEAKPMREYKFLDSERTTPICPKCETILGKADKFCSCCGQRIDNQNYEF